jgi:hypothetical protein
MRVVEKQGKPAQRVEAFSGRSGTGGKPGGETMDTQSQTDTQPKQWWRRMFKGFQRGDAASQSELPPTGEDGLLREPAGEETKTEEGGKGPTGLARWAKRDATLLRLQEGYEKVNQLIADMEKHMVEQSERTERMCSAIDRLAGAMADVPENASAQKQALQSILGQLQSAQSQSERLTSGLDNLSKTVKTQETTMNNMGRHMEVMAEQNVVGTQMTEKLVGTVQGLGDQSTGQTRLLQQVTGHLKEQNDQFQRLTASSLRRVTILWIVTLILAAAGLGAALFAVFMR